VRCRVVMAVVSVVSGHSVTDVNDAQDVTQRHVAGGGQWCGQPGRSSGAAG